MNTAKTLTAALVAGGSLFGAQQALAYNAGDFFARLDATRVEATASGNFDTERSFSGAVGWIFADKFGIEFNTVGQRQELDFTYGNAPATLKYRPFSLLAQFYPLGGSGAQVQPYIGAGAAYTRLSDRDLPGGARVDSSSWDPTVQLGVDYFLTDWIAINGNLQYTTLNPDVDNGIRDDIKIDPLSIGAGVTFRF